MMDAPASSEPTHARAARRAALFDALLERQQPLTVAMREEIQRQLPTYRGLSGELLDPGIARALAGTLRASRSAGRPASEADLAEFANLEQLADVGRSQAELGIPLFELLSTWRIGLDAIMAEASKHAGRLGIPTDEMLEAMSAIIGWLHATTITAARAHQAFELERARHDHEHRADFVRGVLLGTLTPTAIRIDAQAYGIDPTREYVAIRARPAAPEGSTALRSELGLRDASPRDRGLAAVIDGDLAAFLRTPPDAATAGVVGVGPSRALERLNESFRLATRAMITAAGSGLTGVHDFDGLGIRPAISADAEVGESLRRRYVDPLAAMPNASELLTTLRTYFDCSMHVDPAAKRLFIHPNTLRYRIGVFERTTGADLRDPHTAFEVWWALEHAATTTPLS